MPSPVKAPARYGEPPAPLQDEIEFRLVHADGTPIAGTAYVATLSDGTQRRGMVDQNGYARLAGVTPVAAPSALRGWPRLAATDDRNRAGCCLAGIACRLHLGRWPAMNSAADWLDEAVEKVAGGFGWLRDWCWASLPRNGH